MKFLFRTNFVSNEYWDGATYALLTLTTKDLRQIARLKRESVAFLNRMGKILGVSYVGSTNLNLPGHVEYCDDDAADTLSTLLETAGADWMRVPDDFGLPAGVEQADTDHHRLCVHHDGDLWVKSIAKQSSDYAEIELPTLSALCAAGLVK